MRRWSGFASSSFGRPPLMSASYMPANSRSIFASALFTMTRIERSGCDAGAKSSSFRGKQSRGDHVGAAHDLLGSERGSHLNDLAAFRHDARSWYSSNLLESGDVRVVQGRTSVFGRRRSRGHPFKRRSRRGHAIQIG